MRVKGGDAVVYHNVATMGENNMPTVVMTMEKVIKPIFDGIKFFNEKDEVRDNYRVRYIFRDGKRIENDCYDFTRIAEEDNEALSKGD